MVAVHEEVDGLDIGGQHGRRLVPLVLRYTHRPQRRQERKRPTPVRRWLSRTQATLGRVRPGDVYRCRGWKYREMCR